MCWKSEKLVKNEFFFCIFLVQNDPMCSVDYSVSQITEGKTQAEMLIQSLSNILSMLEKSSAFGFEKQEDMKSLASELKSAGSHSFQKSGSKGSLFQSSQYQDTFVQVVEDLNTIGNKWKGYAEYNDDLVLEPLKMLKVSSKSISRKNVFIFP